MVHNIGNFNSFINSSISLTVVTRRVKLENKLLADLQYSILTEQNVPIPKLKRHGYFKSTSIGEATVNATESQFDQNK